MGRTASAASISSDTVYINVEAHSIAYSALYFWIIPAVILSSVIGVSQTEASIPRILRRIQHKPPLSHPEKLAEVITCVNDDRRIVKENLAELSNCFDDHEIRGDKLSKINDCLDNDRTKIMDELIERYKSLARRSKALEKVTEINESLDDRRRISHGGIYSWQPFRWQRKTSNDVQDWKRHALPAYSIVILGTITGITISGLVPPDGPDCRHFGQFSTCLVWLLSAWLDTRLNSMIPLGDTRHNSNNKVPEATLEELLEHKRKLLFRWTMTKDVIITIATLGGVIAVQVGVLNRCSCYTMWGWRGVALPGMPIVYEKLRHRLSTWYPALAFTCIGIELFVIPALIYWQYPDAFRVYLQRDDGKPNLKWLQNPLWRLRKLFTPKSQRRPKLCRKSPNVATRNEVQKPYDS